MSSSRRPSNQGIWPRTSTSRASAPSVESITMVSIIRYMARWNWPRKQATTAHSPNTADDAVYRCTSHALTSRTGTA